MIKTIAFILFLIIGLSIAIRIFNTFDPYIGILSGLGVLITGYYISKDKINKSINKQ